LSAFAGARLVKGSPFIMNAVGWKRRARQADWILTGEGRLDRTSFEGKVAGEVARHRGRARVAVVCGRCSLPAPELRRRGIVRVEELGLRGLSAPGRAVEDAGRRLSVVLVSTRRSSE
jgi:glycerate kinase